ncbi:hypothetical protein LZL87_011433 [Fusarium oxysporum]|nr:hypothetical protein LZL87_011433 [Fusarium oxysporum]
MDSPLASQLTFSALVLLTTIFAYHWLLGLEMLSLARKKVPSKPSKERKTFRISGVPSEWNKDRLQSFLADQDGIDGPDINSLAININNCSSTGTATFQKIPRQLQNGGSWKIPIPSLPGNSSAHKQCLELDSAFLGITPLYSPRLEDHEVEYADSPIPRQESRTKPNSIVAISGLGGHAFGSFKERGGDHMWLRDSLPYDLKCKNTSRPMARVMIYGYKSNVHESNSFQDFDDLEGSFRSSLLALAHTPTTRPIIFIAHSLGGIIVKQTLITLSKSKQEDNLKLGKAVYGIAFFGVPHDGMDISSLVAMVGDKPNRFLIESISRNNPQVLREQRRQFDTALGHEGDSEIICFYETEKSPIAQKKMNGPSECLVTKSSATHCRSWEDSPEHMCAIARTHSDMVKFGPHEDEYSKVKERLIGLARQALLAKSIKRNDDAKFPVPSKEKPHRYNRPGTSEKPKPQPDFGLRDHATKSTSTPSQVREQDIFCFRCDELGHKSPHCNSRKATIIKGLRRREREDRCFHCGGYDHSYNVFLLMAASTSIPILTISLSRHLHGRDIKEGLEEQWSESEVPAATASRFSNIGFDLDGDGANLDELKSQLRGGNWAGIIVGRCSRGNIEFTELFESVVAVCVDYIVETKKGDVSRKEPKLIFCRGPDDLVNATLRNFPN